MVEFIAIAKGALMVLGGVVVVLRVVAPLTDTRLDNKLLKIFTKVESILKKVVAI